MATANVSTTIQANRNNKPSIELLRPLANFPPSTWGDQFLSFSLDNSKLEAYANIIEEQKEDVKRLIDNPSMDSNEKLRLMNCVYRLGLKHHFINEIDCQLDKLFKEFDLKDYEDADLYTTSVNFQVFRQHGYKMSCDVFKKFKDCGSDKFHEYITTDVRGNLAQQVKHALMNPFHRGLQMVEARLYFVYYEEEICSIHDSLLKLANAQFNYMQLLQKEELRILTKIPELYIWILGVFLDPHYSEARIITTKIAQLVLVLDDTYDAYGTIEELRLITDTINRWEFSVMEQLPKYNKPFYKLLLNEYAQLEKRLSKQGRANRVNASRRAFQELASCFMKEAEWRNSGYVPSFQEYMNNGLVTSTYNVISVSCLVGMPEIVSEEALNWYESNPKILEASALLLRLNNDVMSFEFEAEREHQITSVHTYMKSFGVSEDVAIEELKKMIENAWKDINEGFLKPTKVLLGKIDLH
ncbi:hypothetical protein L2E82_31072 [Cichorium intybus]|uniref:Uncharacterized protein n=1 Tax=Cichorium intybus TaxID=13427 RepID=A0ACB9D1Z1_CICIN|nr:hypothetical protein L2E82_31072 [Cichorium intybus]